MIAKKYFTQSMIGLACVTSNQYALTRLLQRETILGSIEVTIYRPSKPSKKEWMNFDLPEDLLTMRIITRYACLSLFIYQMILSAKKLALNEIAGSTNSRNEMEKLNLCGASFQEYLGDVKLILLKQSKPRKQLGISITYDWLI